MMFNPDTSAVPQPPQPSGPSTARNPVRKLVLGGLLIALTCATVVAWPREEPSPVVIVESGFHVIPGSGEQDVAWAAIVENTDHEAVEDMALRVTYRDDEGASDQSQTHWVGRLQPGERQVAVATHHRQDLTGGFGREGLSGPPVDMTVEVDPDIYGSRPEPGSEIATTDLWVGWGRDLRRIEVLSFVGNLENDVGPVPEFGVRMLLVFRDADGRIIGGRTLTTLPNPPQSLPTDQIFAEFDAAEVPEDLATVEVHIRNSSP